MISEKEIVENLGKKVGKVEIGIVQRIADDKPAKDVAHEMGLNKRTMEGKIAKVKKHFGIHSSAALVAIFFRNNLIK